MKSTLQLLTLSLCLISSTIYSQVIGGQHSFEFVNAPASARITALGGTLIAVRDKDVSLAFLNPAALNSDMSGQFHFSHNFQFAGISQGAFNTAKTFDKLGITAHAGIQYTSYGDFVAADNIGNIQGSFSGSEYALVVGAGKQINERIHVGANLKFLGGNLESYSASAIATDIAVTYAKPEAKFYTTLLFRSLGVQMGTYGNDRQSLPLDIQLGVSKQLAHLPLRFSITGIQLQQWNVRYDDPNQVEETNLFGETTETSKLSQDVDNLFRHLVFSGEFLLGKKENLKLRLGYSHLRRKELSVSEFRSMAGFSLGFGLKISKFSIDYGVGYHHLAGGANHITIATNLSEFKKKI